MYSKKSVPKKVFPKKLQTKEEYYEIISRINTRIGLLWGLGAQKP